MGPISDLAINEFGSTIFVELGLHAGFSAAMSSIHGDPSLVASLGRYLAVEKGWFSPYLFASARRPVIPRTMKPDVVFCHGPFLPGDYAVGKTLVEQSATVLHLCKKPAEEDVVTEEKVSMSERTKLQVARMNEKIIGLIHRSKSTTGILKSAPESLPPVLQEVFQLPRRLAVVLLGLKPHRLGMWTSSTRPSESVLKYILLDGAPTILLPALPVAPLLAWDTLTLKQMQAKQGKYEGVVKIMYEYLSLCVDWERVIVGEREEGKKRAVRDAVELIVAAAVASGDSKAVLKDVDLDRAGIVIFRIPRWIRLI
ncbi:uncharacterized protein RCO7_03611 [Rhynchosporium graminicola]|uniref:Uncharacterized protein n=1 Tax=Rhynchosporium graminicola TaxID=2792576 RepID=A0A1E1LQT1_9HELO|nr:uncharacterized protein RCO7_03611 [Rhynchosporium commune]